MKSRINAVVVSNVGTRPNQEDNFLLGKHICLESEDKKQMEENPQFIFVRENEQENMLCAIADGMGGHAAGEEASRQTIALLDSFYDDFVLQMHNDTNIQHYFDRINETVYRNSLENKALRGMGSTLCASAVTDGEVLFVCAGDSRAYLYDGKLMQVSEDHCEGNRLKKLGILNEEEVHHFPARKALYKYVGYDGIMRAELIRRSISVQSKPCYILLCSDGLTDQVSDMEIEEVLDCGSKSVKEKAVNLIKTAMGKNNTAKDNVTMILMEITRSES